MTLRLLPALLLALAAAACQGETTSYADAVEVVELEETAAPTVQPASQTVRPAPVDAPADRLLVRTASLTLRADDHAEAVAQARALAAAADGFVGDEQSQRYAGRVETTLTIRAPASRFDTLMAALAALPGEVESRSVSVDDVTRQVADVEARLRARRAAEDQFVAILGRAGSIEDVLAVQTQLQRVREEIESAEAQLRAVRDQLALSTIRLTVFEASAAGITAGPGFFARAGRAAAAGWNGLLELVLALVAVWPLVLGVGALAWLVLRRRRVAVA